jgi:predicted outer membrane repeat protein
VDSFRFDQLTRSFVQDSSRRALLLSLGTLALPGLADAKKKGKKRKKKKCAKAGQPTSKKRKKCCSGLIKDGTGVCAAPCTPATCAGTNLCVNGTCQPCDVCASGCFFSSVQAAIDVASPGQTITVCAGTFTGNLDIDQDLTLIGAGSGFGAGNTILQGTGTGSVVTNILNAVTLRSLRIVGGNAASHGGGIRSQSGPLELIDCTVTGNTAPVSGGGIYAEGSLILTKSVITGNVASERGGGIAIFGTVTLDAASRVTGNDANEFAPDSGGGIYINGGTVTLSSTENVTGNEPDNCAPNGAVAMCID